MLVDISLEGYNVRWCSPALSAALGCLSHKLLRSTLDNTDVFNQIIICKYPQKMADMSGVALMSL